MQLISMTFIRTHMHTQVEMGLMPDFILAMGDEESDEMMYEAVEDFSRGVKGEEPGTPDANNTATQGAGNSPGRRRGSYQVTTYAWDGGCARLQVFDDVVVVVGVGDGGDWLSLWVAAVSGDGETGRQAGGQMDPPLLPPVSCYSWALGRR